jgi:REP element-mobilizing transposase RayT
MGGYGTPPLPRDGRARGSRMFIRSRKSIIHDSAEYALKELYFITICVFQKSCRLGEIVNSNVKTYDTGDRIVLVINQMNRMFHIEVISEYIVMPNHFHMIVDMGVLNQDKEEKVKTITDIVRDFKSYTTHEFNQTHPDIQIPLWQRGYYDHRIRNDEDYKMIKEYIRNNPVKWTADRFYHE